MKRIPSCILLLSLCLISFESRAEAPKFSFGLEWGYSVSFLNLRQYNYIDPEGSRVNYKGTEYKAHSNGNILASAGIDLGKKCNLAICSGYLGIEDNIRLIPAILRFSVCPSGMEEGGFIMSLEGGAGMNVLRNENIIPLAAISGGYRISQASKYYIGIKLYARAAYDNPLIFDPYYSGYVPEDRIRTNDAIYLSAGISLSLEF